MFAAIIGFCIALYIYRKQKAKKPLMCPRKSPCETVITSPQATTHGISNTVLGMVFYATALFLILCIIVGGRSFIAELALLLLGTAGFAFSFYLVRVQQQVIKQWCIWCLGSAVTATVLFVVSILLFF